MAYTATLKSAQVVIYEGQETGSDPLRANQYGGRVKSAVFSYTAVGTSAPTVRIALCVIPKNASIIGIVHSFIKTNATCQITHVCEGFTTGTSVAPFSAPFTSTTVDQEFLANRYTNVQTDVPTMVIGIIGTANMVAGDVLSGSVLYVVD